MLNGDSLLISVIIPAFNAEKYISKCVESIVRNSYKNLEIIIVNDGSEDNTLNIAKELKNRDSRIAVINKKNGGVSSARNKGLDIAKGEYVAFIDSDDYISENYFETLISETQSGADITSCRHICVNESGNVLLDPFSKVETVITYTAQDLADNYFRLVTAGVINSTCGKLYNKALIGETRFSHTLKWGEDASFNLEVFKKMEKMTVLPDKGYFYVLHDGQTITKKMKGRGDMLIEYVGNINNFLKYYNVYQYPNIRIGMGSRCISDFFSAASNSFSLKEYKDVFFRLKNTEWYQYIFEVKPRKQPRRILLTWIENDRYAAVYYLSQIYNLLVRLKRKIKKCR